VNANQCQADTGSGPCSFVAVRMARGAVPDAGFPTNHQLALFDPGEWVTTYTCALHARGVVDAMLDLGLIDVHTAPPPGPGWQADGLPTPADGA